MKNGEKFALIGLNALVDPGLLPIGLEDGFAILTGQAFVLPEHWQEWLGIIRTEEVQKCSLFLAATAPSDAPAIYDAGNHAHQKRVGHWFMGLMLEMKFYLLDDPFLASGGRSEDETNVRHFSVLQPPHITVVNDERPISLEILEKAALIASHLEALTNDQQAQCWRLLRCLSIYRSARHAGDMLDRIHQFTRCIEGLIVPDQGHTGKQFKSRTELFVGPRHHNLMAEIYDVRSDVEHLHEDRHVASFDRATRIRLAKLEAASEWIARSCLAHILVNPVLLDHFGSVDALNSFWARDRKERIAIWGKPVDPLTPLAGFSFDHVSDAELGAGE